MARIIPSRCMRCGVYGANARGMALIGDRTSDREIESLTEAGMRGARINLRLRPGTSTTSPAGARSFRPWPRGHGNTTGTSRCSPARRDRGDRRIWCETRPCPWCSIISAASSGAGTGAARVRGSGRTGPLGQCLRQDLGRLPVSAAAPEYADIAPFARALIAANADRILWGSDWPHPTGVTPPGRAPRK